MIKKIKLSFLAIITAFFFSTPVVAEESSYSISGNIGMMSDYVFRGIPQSSSSAYGGVDFESSGFYLGTWFADLGPSGKWESGSHQGIEYDVYAGYGMDITDTLSGYIGYTIYRYSDKGSDAFDDDYDEFNIGFSYAVSDDFSVSLDYANGENTAVGGTETDYDVGTITFDYLGLTLTVGDWGISEDDTGETDASWWELGYGATVGDFDISGALIFSEKELATATDSGEDGDFTNVVFSIGYSF